MNIGKTIEKYLQETGSSQHQLAKACGVSQSVISKLVTNKAKGCHSSTYQVLMKYIDQQPPPAPEQAQAHDDTEQGGSPWTSAV